MGNVIDAAEIMKQQASTDMICAEILSQIPPSYLEIDSKEGSYSPSQREPTSSSDLSIQATILRLKRKRAILIKSQETPEARKKWRIERESGFDVVVTVGWTHARSS